MFCELQILNVASELFCDLTFVYHSGRPPHLSVTTAQQKHSSIESKALLCLVMPSFIPHPIPCIVYLCTEDACVVG